VTRYLPAMGGRLSPIQKIQMAMAASGSLLAAMATPSRGEETAYKQPTRTTGECPTGLHPGPLCGPHYAPSFGTKGLGHSSPLYHTGSVRNVRAFRSVRLANFHIPPAGLQTTAFRRASRRRGVGAMHSTLKFFQLAAGKWRFRWISLSASAAKPLHFCAATLSAFFVLSLSCSR